MINKFSVKSEFDSKILLHACCAPCALSPVPEFAAAGLAFDAFFYNPNIYDAAEHDKRLAEVKKIAGIFGFELFIRNDEYSKFLEFVSGLENEPEGAARCAKCIEMRLAAAFEFASAGGYKYVATTLSTSPHKNVKLINSLGAALSEKHGGLVKLIEFDFKKNDGYKNSVDYCKKYSIYRQTYCGCHFSKR
ncbi:MAG: hypothetical protein ACD_47C00048G0003 [uncultured bacterium]|uniref:Epoxyqueuosine reductase QueH n=1 Tax=Candidatus Wallbacteria bacterium GWC2_49_35 TaxID=1817813 RepID=A0A1F7WNF1_9BACT|nr:MAG: hypothetical protein ACD_47C00048G0003 [uncultured bacterium]OGM03648.1 MAG: hypothetical protein A2008_10025 [Candidatus Wallbacteria bacterium GWC2_49_35]HBC74922.1 hypothetical protein [Candidatus Wallbacteria bacterium]